MITAVPVLAAPFVHVEADEQNALRIPPRKLQPDIQGLKAAISTTADSPRILLNFIAILLPTIASGDLDAADIGIFGQRNAVASPANLYANELGKPSPVPPPGGIAAIDHIRPRAEVDILLDGYDLRAPAQKREINLFR